MSASPKRKADIFLLDVISVTLFIIGFAYICTVYHLTYEFCIKIAT